MVENVVSARHNSPDLVAQAVVTEPFSGDGGSASGHENVRAFYDAPLAAVTRFGRARGVCVLGSVSDVNGRCVVLFHDAVVTLFHVFGALAEDDGR